MAKRRMISIPILENDKFYSLSSASQAFYLHLNLNADDDGVVDKVNLIMSQMHLKRKCYKELVDLGYLIEFEEGLVVITHWHQHNQIRKERYVQGEYLDRLSTLSLQENGRFFKASEHILGDKSAPQDSIGKESIDKGSIAEYRKDEKEEKDKEKEKLSFLHTEAVSQNDTESVFKSETQTSPDGDLVSTALKNVIALYCMKKYQTIDISEFIKLCETKKWIGDGGESIKTNYKKYVDRWMEKK